MKVLTLATIAILAVALAGCKSGDSTASNSPDAGATATTTGGGTAGATTTSGDTAGATTTAGDTSGASADNSGNTLTGKWDMTNNPAAPTTYEFKDDGTEEIVAGPMADPSGKMKGKMTVTSDMTYKVDGNKITQTMTSLEASSDNDADKEGVDAANKQYADMAKTAKPIDGTITWKDKDDVVISAGGKDADLKRQAAS